MNLELYTLPSVAPSCQSIAPPLRPAILLSNIQSVNDVLVQLLSTLLCRYTAPPLCNASLLVKLVFSTLPIEPVQRIAPPLPPNVG